MLVLFYLALTKILHSSVTRYQMGFEEMRKWRKKLVIEVFQRQVTHDRVTY